MWTLIAALWLGLETVDQRTFADGSVQERWSYDGAPAPETLTEKEWFWPDGERKRLEEYRAGVLHGRTAEWDSSGRLLNEAQYANGELHGPVRRWQSWHDEPWVEHELNYNQGQLHGDQTRWSERGVVEVRNHYEHGLLHGNQQAWQSGGSALYDLNFVHGVPEGQQRFWGDNDLHPDVDMHFVDGVPHGPQRYWWSGDWQVLEWVDGELTEGAPPDLVRVYAMELEAQKYYSEDDAAGPLRFEIDHTLIREITHHDDGAVRTIRDRVEPHGYAEYAPDGTLILQGTGVPHDRVGEWKAWRPDGTLLRHEQWTEHKHGSVVVYDADGAVRRTETWDWNREAVVVRDVRDGVLLAEGDVEPQNMRNRMGTWTYYNPDGSVRRTERYEFRSASVPEIVESREERPDGTVCEGPQDAVVCVTPTPEGGAIELTVQSRQSNRYADHSYDPDTFEWVPRDLEKRELHADAVLVTVLDGPGVVRKRRVLDDFGEATRTETYDRSGALEQIESRAGWVETYRKGELRTITEPHPNGGVCTATPRDEGLFVVVEHPDGQVSVQGVDRHQDKVVAQCPLFERMPIESPR